MTRRGHVVDDRLSCERCLKVNLDFLLRRVLGENGDDAMNGCEDVMFEAPYEAIALDLLSSASLHDTARSWTHGCACYPGLFRRAQ